MGIQPLLALTVKAPHQEMTVTVSILIHELFDVS